MLVFLLTLFYAPLAPVVIPFGIAGGLTAFWIEKVFLAKVNLLVSAFASLQSSRNDGF